MTGAQRVEDLVAYQRTVALRNAVYDITAGGRIAGDPGFRDRIRSAAGAAPRNLAEGFGRCSPRDFAGFAMIARGAIADTQNCLQHGLRERYFSRREHEVAWTLACRAMGSTARLLRHLRRRGSRR